MKKLLIIAILATLAGCGQHEAYDYRVDQCLRQELFKQCMSVLPKGPERIHNSNDWDEVVEACNSTSYGQARRLVNTIKEECKGY